MIDLNLAKEIGLKIVTAANESDVRSAVTALTLLLGGSSGHPEEKAVVYGKGGYTDAGDPRQDNAKQHVTDPSGLIRAVHLTVHVNPQARYRCINAYVIDEVQAKGQTAILISVKNKSGATANERVLMATGYSGDIGHFDEYLEPGNAYVPVQHTLADSHQGKGCSFAPPDLGPIAIFVAGSSHEIDSDVVGNLGLPLSHHVSFFLEFQER